MEAGRVVHTGRDRIPEPSAIARLAMRVTGVVASLAYLAFFIYFRAAFDNIVPAAFVAVSSVFQFLKHLSPLPPVAHIIYPQLFSRTQKVSTEHP
jgi:succinate dehydrogenase hydrophobic anchor subunit